MKIWVIVASTIAGFALGLFLAWGSGRGLFSRWRSLGSPPGRVIEFVAADMQRVFVQTEDGNIHTCRHSAAVEECWSEAHWPQELTPSPYLCSPPSFRVSSPPGDAVASLQIHYCLIESASRIDFALLEDGQVWMIKNSTNPLPLAAYTLPTGLAGFLAGISISAGLYVVRRYLRDQPRAWSQTN